MIDVHREIPQSGKTLTAVLGLAVILGVMWVVSTAIASQAIKGVFLMVAVIAVAGVAGKTLSNWRTGVYLFLFWLLFEDMVRKYMGNSMWIYFGKDALIAATYIAFVMTRFRGEETGKFRVPFKYPLGMFVLLGLAQCFNPNSPSLWYSVLGLKLYFYYIPLMFVGYALVREERDLQRFAVINMIPAIPIALLGILQAIIGLDFLNPHTGSDIEYLGHLNRYTSTGLVVPRPPSVFVSDGRFGSYVLLAFILGLGAAGYLLLRSKWGRKIVFPALALLGVASAVTGSRGSVVFVSTSALVISAGMLWGAPRKWGEGYRLIKAIRRSFIFVALALGIAITVFPNVIGSHWAFYKETLSPDSPQFELADRAGAYQMTQLSVVADDPEWIIGHGMGTASLGGQYVSRLMGAPTTNIGVENGWGNLILEFGILGLILWLVWTSSLIYSAAKVTLKLKGTWAFPMAFSILWYAFLLLFPFTYSGLDSFQNFVLNAYFWLLVGILFRLPDLVTQESGQQPTVPSQQFGRRSPAARM